MSAVRTRFYCLRPCLPSLHSSFLVLRLCFPALHQCLFGLHSSFSNLRLCFLALHQCLSGLHSDFSVLRLCFPALYRCLSGLRVGLAALPVRCASRRPGLQAPRRSVVTRYSGLLRVRCRWQALRADGAEKTGSRKDTMAQSKEHFHRW